MKNPTKRLLSNHVKCQDCHRNNFESEIQFEDKNVRKYDQILKFLVRFICNIMNDN